MLVKKSNDRFLTAFVIIACICLVGIFCYVAIYFVVGISDTFPPIRVYNCSGRVSEFEAGIDKISKTEKNITYKITDTVGSKDNGFAMHMTIIITSAKRSIEYNIKYESNDTQTKLALIMANDWASKLGGYGIKADGMYELLSVFEKKIIYGLIKQGFVINQDES
ncbi:hypothetical protein FPZ43_15465 [Mucilaginibacter pallidiroseus]|uniref:Uncharacterized protein n=1 Tax=Mucilaginibacter pallidiroseus TaxID=2599295 RepID=A0A563U5C1_9SPHI|nr:hypothetical protein [Mucilaginibacter pallidiroseus]TWR26550.1 hypothetical protein FPZ43_15465 [Mucilaginibacter pallidiroseus]